MRRHFVIYNRPTCVISTRLWSSPPCILSEIEMCWKWDSNSLEKEAIIEWLNTAYRTSLASTCYKRGLWRLLYSIYHISKSGSYFITVSQISSMSFYLKSWLYLYDKHFSWNCSEFSVTFFQTTLWIFIKIFCHTTLSFCHACGGRFNMPHKITSLLIM